MFQSPRRGFRIPFAGILVLPLVLAGQVALAAGPSAAAPPPDRAKASLDQFANQWMAKMGQLEANNRAQASRQPAGAPVKYRAYGSNYTTELKPTGSKQAPYVGLIRYEEREVSCKDKSQKECEVSERTPVTEIFRFQNGRWIY
jgi:hypothetical protein